MRGKPKENWETGSFYHGLTRLDYQPLFGKMSPHSSPHPPHPSLRGGSKTGPGRRRKSSLRANALRNAYKMPLFLSCLKPLFQSEVKWEAIDVKMIFTLKQISLIFTRKVLHWASFWKWEFLKLGNSLCSVGSLKAARWRTGLKTTVVRSATGSWQQRAESVRKWRVSDAPSQSLPLLPLSLISNNLFFE